MGPALSQGGVHPHHGDHHPCHQLAEGDGVQQVSGGAGNPPWILLFLLCWLCLQISPPDCDQVDAEYKAEVGDDGEKTDDEENGGF